MNYLAHIALSGENTNIMLGNFIGDFVKGDDFKQYPEEFKTGILLHRTIDSFTDSHPIALESKRRFYKDYPKVGGIITDILYDYFLCQNWDLFYEIDLETFINNTYKTLELNKHHFPKDMDYLYQHLTENDWFKRYQTQEGTALSLSQIGKRFNYSRDLGNAFDIVNNNYESFQNEFTLFYTELQNHCNEFLIK